MTPAHSPYRITDSSMLYAWLRKATWGLCPEAAERVSQEIKEHYIAAVEERMADGMALVPAEAAALKALGSPRAARRSFRDGNVTAGEALILCKLLGRPALGMSPQDPVASFVTGLFAPLSYAMISGLGLSIAYSSDDHGHGVSAGFNAAVFFFLLCDSLPWWLRRGLKDRAIDAVVIGRLRQVMRLQLLLCAAIFLIAATTAVCHFVVPRDMYSSGESISLPWFCLALMWGFGLILVAGVLLPTFRLHRKLSAPGGRVQP